MNEYELAILLHPDLEIDLDSPLKKVEDLVNKAGGKVLSRDDWGKRKLAYPITKQNFGIYVFYRLEIPKAKVVTLEKSLQITDEVIRHLIVKYVEPPVPKKKKKKVSAAPVKESVTKKSDKE